MTYEYEFTIWPIKGSKLWRSTALKAILTDIPPTIIHLTEDEYRDMRKELAEIGFHMIGVKRRIYNEFEKVSDISPSGV